MKPRVSTCTYVFTSGTPCDRPRRERHKFCSAHEHRMTRKQDMDKPIAPRTKQKGLFCRYCTKPARSQGLCHAHWNRANGRPTKAHPAGILRIQDGRGSNFRVDAVRIGKEFRNQLDRLARARGYSRQRIIKEIVEAVLTHRVQGERELVSEGGLDATAWARRTDVWEAA